MSIQWPSTSYAEDIARAVHEILSSAGADALTIRGIARAARVSPGTLANQFESREGLLARIALVVGRLLAVDLAGRELGQTGVDRLCTMVVRDEYERADLKVWLDLVALARASEAIGAHVRGAEARLRAVAGDCFRDVDPVTEGDAIRLRAWLVLQAVWAYQLTPGTDLDVEEARELVRRLMSESLRS